MSTVALLAAAGDRARGGYAVSVARDWPAAREAYAAAAAAPGTTTPFQQTAVMDAWYGAMAVRRDVDPLLVTVRDARTGRLAAMLPLIRRRSSLVRVIAFADLDLCDYNAPVLGPAAPTGLEDARAFWRDLRGALPAADLLSLRKMPLAIGQRPNPLALLPGLPCELNGNVLRLGPDYQGSLRALLKRVVRKELERSRRVFERHPDATFRAVTEPEERRRVLAAIERQQPLRMERAGRAYALDAPAAADFYRRLIETDRIALTALFAGHEVVAALAGLRSDARYTMIRISSSSDPAWTTCSPGRLIIERTMAHAHADGVRDFDFSVGNYDYKRRFGVEPLPLVDLVRPLTSLGLAGAGTARARAWLRARPELETRLRRVLGKPTDRGSER